MKYHGQEAISMPLLEPLVSIGFPVRNGERFIHRALHSLLNQEYRNIEVIISDNASTDKTVQICEDFARNDDRLRLLRNKTRIETNANFRRVAQFARGPYFMWATCGDIWHKQFIATLINAMIHHPANGICISSLTWIDSKTSRGEEVSLAKNGCLQRVSQVSRGDLFRRLLMLSSDPVSWDINTIIFGIVQTNLMRALLRRKIPSSYAPERILLAELAFATHFATIEENLIWKLHHQKLFTETGDEAELGQESNDSWSWTKFIFTILWRLCSSSMIPISKKLIYVLPACVGLALTNRKQIVSEIKRNLNIDPKHEEQSKLLPNNKQGPQTTDSPVELWEERIGMSLSEFDEEFYLTVNPDVAQAVSGGLLPSGLAHFLGYGLKEGRKYRRKRSTSLEHGQ